MRIRSLALILLLSNASCARHDERSRTDAAHPTAAKVAAPSRLELETGPPSSASSTPARLEVTQAQGLPAERIQTLLAPAAEPLHRCMSGRTGKITLRVTSRNGALAVSVEPGVSLGDAARTCAFDALSTVVLEETGSNAGGPGIPPSGFTSLVTVSW
jgi:hypothetical protein